MHDRDLRADLIVDATGRGSQLPEWLETMGHPRVEEDVVDAQMTYASRLFSVAPGALRGWQAAYVQAALPHDPRGGIMFPVEGNRWHLTLFGYGDAAPPHDEAGFLTFARRLRSRIISDILQRATPLTPIVGHRRTENRLRHFERLQRWPDGLVAVGDSMCCFDPVYGQGMTTGILGALALAELIDARWHGGTAPAGFTARVQRRLAHVVRPAWNLATGEDLRLPSTTGGQLERTDRLMQRFFDRVVATATANPQIRKRLLSVMSMLSAPHVLLHPRVMAAVVRHALAPGRAHTLWTERDDSVSAYDSGVSLPRALRV
jgi:2-polyprenyl-6-methoxyphenol hydroxylase-like FAD-dependent oxidoreductase